MIDAPKFMGEALVVTAAWVVGFAALACLGIFLFALGRATVRMFNLWSDL